MEILDNAKGWLFSVAARKAVLKAVECAMLWLASGVVQGYLAQAGIHYDPVQVQAALTGLGMTGVAMAKDYFRLKGWNL